MGNKQSRIKRPPHDVLGLPTTATRQEVRDSYRRLILKAHPDARRVHSSEASGEAVEIMEAYTSMMRSPPSFSLYTEDLFRTDLRKYAEDFFERVATYCELVGAPKFSSPDFERFYHMFINFRTQRPFDTDEERVSFCRSVRNIARIVHGLDRRVNTDPVTVDASPAARPKVKEKKAKVYSFSCTHCAKGFHSRNQAIDHFRSKKHLEKVALVSHSPQEYIERQISEISLPDLPKESLDIPAEPAPPYPVDTKTPEQDPVPKVAVYRQEPAPFRTCAKCRLVFSTRTELFTHLKTSHKAP